MTLSASEFGNAPEKINRGPHSASTKPKTIEPPASTRTHTSCLSPTSTAHTAVTRRAASPSLRPPSAESRSRARDWRFRKSCLLISSSLNHSKKVKAVAEQPQSSSVRISNKKGHSCDHRQISGQRVHTSHRGMHRIKTEADISVIRYFLIGSSTERISLGPIIILHAKVTIARYGCGRQTCENSLYPKQICFAE